jgi:hypothetical protein
MDDLFKPADKPVLTRVRTARADDRPEIIRGSVKNLD